MTAAAGHRLADRPWPEVGRPMLLVPLGSTEQHGPHLPLDTDTVVASVVCDALADRLTADGIDVVVAPALGYGASGEHQGFAGTISIGTEALALLLLEYGRSACEWAGRVVFVNGHGGNVEALATAVPRLIAEGRPAAWLPCGTGAAMPGDAHAGRTETSLMLAVAPTRVHADRVEAGDDTPITELLPRLRAGGVRAVSPNGVLGDPRGATAAEGARILDAVVVRALSRLGHGSEAGATDAGGCLLPPPPNPPEAEAFG